jgi:hypothetical protein
MREQFETPPPLWGRMKVGGSGAGLSIIYSGVCAEAFSADPPHPTPLRTFLREFGLARKMK